MGKPKYRWWGFAMKMIRDYPGLKKTLDDLHEQTLTADISRMPKGGSSGRTVEAIALQQLPRDDQKVYDAVSRAIEITQLQQDGHEHIALIRYVYWHKKKHTLKDAALRLYISDTTAQRWHGEFVRLVGKYYGFSVNDIPAP